MSKRNNFVSRGLLCVLSIITYSCCTNASLYNVDEEILFSSLPDPMDLSSSVRMMNHVVGSTQIADAGEYLVVLSADKTGFINIIEKASGQLVLKCGTLGRGPNEFFSLPETGKFVISNSSSDLLLYLYDDSKIGALNINRTVTAGHTVFDSFNPMADYLAERKMNYSFRTVFPDHDRTFICLGVSYEDARDGLTGPPCYSLMSKTGKKDYDIFPSLLVNESYPVIPLFAYSGCERMSRDGERIILSSALFDASIVIDIPGENTKLIRNSSSIFLEDCIGTDRDVLMSKSKYNTIDLDAGRNHFVQLYDGRMVNDANQGLKEKKPTLRVWDYDGILKAHYSLDILAKSIAFAENESKIYILDEEDYIYSIDIYNYLQ